MSQVFQILSALCLVVSVRAFAADETYQINIEPQRLSTALQQFAQQSGLQVVYYGKVAQGVQAEGVKGTLTAKETLQKLLAGTGLKFESLDQNTVAISGAEEEKSSRLLNSQAAPVQLAQKDSSTAATNPAPLPVDGRDGGITEIVVTAQKKKERLQDVPVPVSVIEAQTLTDTNQVDMRDYYSSVPGLNIYTDIVGQQDLTIRGIGAVGGSAPTVGVTVDDVPYGGSTFPTSAGSLPDFDPGDLARIEVLRGPQGTLYGANSMGGLVKFVTVDPSPTAFSGRLEAGTSTVNNGAEPGFSVRGSLNIPLTETLAIRVSGYDRQDPGYIDNPSLHRKGINEIEATGARLAAQWQPSDILSLKLSALYQHVSSDSNNDVDVPTSGYPQTYGLSGLVQNYIPGAGALDRKIQAYSAVLKVKIGAAELTSVTGYNVDHTQSSLDYTFSSFLSSSVSATPGLGGVTGVPYIGADDLSKVTQEIRLSIPLTQHLEWLFGGFYSHERDPAVAAFDAENATTGQITGQYWTFAYLQPVTFQEYAGFTDLTYRFTDNLDIQVGARETEVQLHEGPYINTGPGVPVLDYPFPSSPYIAPAEESKANAFTYLVTPRLKLNPDVMLYARFASGFRPGSPNAIAPGAPPYSKPDKTENYELGAKVDFLDHRLSIDTSLYYIAFKNIQVSVYDVSTSGGYFTNGGGAKSEGIELSLAARPLAGLTLSGWIAYDDAVLTQNLPGNSTLYGLAGDRLPNTSRFSGNLSFEDDFPIPSSKVIGFVGAMTSFVGDRLGNFNSTPPTPPLRQDFPGYIKTDLRAGVKMDFWTVNLFVNNVSNSRGLVGGGLLYDPPYARVYITPRTIGLNAIRRF